MLRSIATHDYHPARCDAELSYALQLRVSEWFGFGFLTFDFTALAECAGRALSNSADRRFDRLGRYEKISRLSRSPRPDRLPEMSQDNPLKTRRVRVSTSLTRTSS